jgi:hypothetical protein
VDDVNSESVLILVWKLKRQIKAKWKAKSFPNGMPNGSRMECRVVAMRFYEPAKWLAKGSKYHTIAQKPRFHDLAGASAKFES